MYRSDMRTVLLAALALVTAAAAADQKRPVWSDAEKPIAEQIRHLRDVPDDKRAGVTRQLALDIRALPVTENKLRLAAGLANLSTEGDFGHDALQEVATTLASALHEQPGINEIDGESPYLVLAQLIRYENVRVSLGAPQLTAALSKLEADEQARRNADFTLTDLHGKQWTLRQLRGSVVVVNFWATWCPPCRKEMPDLEALYERYKDRGLVVLAISDEDAEKVRTFLADRHVSYPVLLDPGRKVNDLFRVEGIPKSFVYDRDGKLVAQAMDMRTRGQFLAMLSRAGLQ